MLFPPYQSTDSNLLV